MKGSQLKHGQVLVEAVEMWLSEKIPPSWQEEGDLQKVWEPVVLRPERSHQCQV